MQVRIIKEMIHALLKEVLVNYSDLDPSCPPLCLDLTTREMMGAISEHCDTIYDVESFCDAVHDVWDEAREVVAYDYDVTWAKHDLTSEDVEQIIEDNHDDIMDQLVELASQY